MRLNRDHINSNDEDIGIRRLILNFINNIILLSDQDREETLRNILLSNRKQTALEFIALFNGAIEELL